MCGDGYPSSPTISEISLPSRGERELVESTEHGFVAILGTLSTSV